MGIRCFPAAESFESAFAAVEFEVRVDGEDVQGAGADSGACRGGGNEDAFFFDGAVVDDVEWL